ncbi:MAG: glycoside hydrolase family 3 C-terminal domain-containing protein, partial [Candidatus Aminicenantales bacterium]
MNDKVRRHLRLRFAIGMMPGQARPAGARNTPEHQRLARQIAEEAIVLLKNRGLLPLDKGALKRVAVLGANANRKQAGGGGSSEVKPPNEITPYAGLAEALAGKAVVELADDIDDKLPGPDRPASQKTLELARSADAVVYVTGLNKTLDTEGADRTSLAIPAADCRVLEQVLGVNPRMVVVVLAGSPVEMPWKDRAAAILYASYLGQEAGRALAGVLLGDVNPSGRLAVTFPQNLTDSPAHAVPDGYLPTTSVYREGIFLGYRWFDAKKI